MLRRAARPQAAAITASVTAAAWGQAALRKSPTNPTCPVRGVCSAAAGLSPDEADGDLDHHEAEDDAEAGQAEVRGLRGA